MTSGLGSRLSPRTSQSVWDSISPRRPRGCGDVMGLGAKGTGPAQGWSGLGLITRPKAGTSENVEERKAGDSANPNKHRLRGGLGQDTFKRPAWLKQGPGERAPPPSQKPLQNLSPACRERLSAQPLSSFTRHLTAALCQKVLFKKKKLLKMDLSKEP